MSVSTATPSQSVSSFDHRVTQCRSVVNRSVASSLNSSQEKVRSVDCWPTVSVQSWSAISGVGPAVRTGKSSTRYCPGGSRSLLDRRLPSKPRVVVTPKMLPTGATG